MANGKLNIKMPTVDDILGLGDAPLTQRSGTEELPISSIADFPKHPFKVRLDDEMDKLVENIKLVGVISPAIVRPMPDGSYQMISGHRRKKACEIAGIKTMPCIVREMDDDQAIILMCDANLQRERIMPSERAASYKMKMEAMKRQAGRPSKNSSPVASNFGKETAEILGGESGESKDQVYRYIRLNELIPELLDLVDEDRIAFRPAVELSYLSHDEQKDLYEMIQTEEATPSLAQAIQIKKDSQAGTLTPEKLFDTVRQQKPNQREVIKFDKARYERYFKGADEKRRYEIMDEAMSLWEKEQIRKRNREMVR